MDLPNVPTACPPEPPPPQARAVRRVLQDSGGTASIVRPCALFAVLTTRLLGPLSLFWPVNAILLSMLLHHPGRASPAGGPAAPLTGLTASFGLAACGAARPQNLDALLARADAALYAAKAAGRDRVECAPDTQEESHARS